MRSHAYLGYWDSHCKFVMFRFGWVLYSFKSASAGWVRTAVTFGSLGFCVASAFCMLLLLEVICVCLCVLIFWVGLYIYYVGWLGFGVVWVLGAIL